MAITEGTANVSTHEEGGKIEWQLLELIGKGTYGEVYKGKSCKGKDELEVAVKVTEFNLSKNEETKTELAVLEKYSHHENIVKFIDAQFVETLTGTEQLWIVTEFCQHGAVCELAKKLIKNGNALEEELIALIILETLKGLQYLHKNNVIHRDIKGSNILLSSDASVKLIDFGVSAVLQEASQCRSSVGTPFWMAPEVIACEQQLDYSYDCRCDVWSLGITSIELGDGDPPLVSQHPMRALFKIPRSPPPTVKRPDRWSQVYLDFISRCLVKDFEKRPFVDDLLEHSFVSGISLKSHILRRKLLTILSLNRSQNERKATTKIEEDASTKSKLDYRRNQAMAKISNLATLENLDEDVILGHLLERYLNNQIYTYIGDILIAVNPFKQLDIYNSKVADDYRQVKGHHLPPHVYQVARSTHLAVLNKRKNQCCVISGESGSGKTVTSNYLVEQLAALGKDKNPALVNKILLVNPLMEAFGNAVTNINENSSRFGKFLELSFTQGGSLVEAQLTEYLLEKSRVVHQSRGERNFHILYYLIAGLDYHRKLGNFDLSSGDQHRYLNTDDKTLDQFACTPVMQEKFMAIQKCFDIIGFSQEEVQSLYCILAAVIHLGDVEIEADDSMRHHGEQSCIQSTDTINTVASLLCVKPDDLSNAITSTSSVTRGETIVRYNTVEQSLDCRDATAKALYSRLFSWIVKKINILLKSSHGYSSPRNNYKKIGILDIFGFENFHQNSFEQLCINIANEQLQFYFNQHVFEWEFEEYKSEGIPLDTIHFENNRPVLEMFLQRPMGLLALLDEESRFPRATVFSLVEKFCDNLGKSYFQKPKDSTSMFYIHHYAGKVAYDASGFLEKNRDTISSDVMQLLRLSDDRLVRTIFQGASDSPDDSKRRGSISSGDSFVMKDGALVENKHSTPHLSTNRLHLTMSVHFRNSLRSLMAKMIHADPHFIRCIRPNSLNIPAKFDQEKVMTQLRYTGVLETSRIRRQGYSERIPFGEFVDRYKRLIYYTKDDPPRDAATCRAILKKIGIETNWRIGKTKVFLKYFQVTELVQLLEDQRRKAVIMQRCIKAWLYKIRFRNEKASMVKSAVMIQKHVRGWLARKRVAYMKGEETRKTEVIEERRERSAVRIQARNDDHSNDKRQGNDGSINSKGPDARGHLARKRHKKMLEEREKEARAKEYRAASLQPETYGDDPADSAKEPIRRQFAEFVKFVGRLRHIVPDTLFIQWLKKTKLATYPWNRDQIESGKESEAEEDEDEMALHDTKTFFFLTQIQMSSADMTPLLHRTTYPVLYSLRKEATEKARKEASNQKIGSRERVLAVLDGTDDNIQSKYRWAREKFESKPHYSRHQPTRSSQKHQEEPISESEQSKEREVSETDAYNASKSERRDRNSFRATNNEQRNTRPEEDRMLNRESRKEYPLRSVVERNGETDIRRRDNVDVSGFQWVVPRNVDTNATSYLARETSISTEETTFHHQTNNDRGLASKIWQPASHRPAYAQNVTNKPSGDYRPYNYLQSAALQNGGAKSVQRMNGVDDSYHYPHERNGDVLINEKPLNYHNGQWDNRRGHASRNTDINTNIPSYYKEKSVRDPFNRPFPRTDVDFHFKENGVASSNQVVKAKPQSAKESSSSLASQITAHLAAQKAKSLGGPSPPNPRLNKDRVKYGKEMLADSEERSLTSMENASTLKQVNGFSYGIASEQRGLLQDFNLRKTGRLKQLVQT